MSSLRQSLAQKSVNTFNHNSSADWARELFKPFVVAERLVFTIQKKLGRFGFDLFGGDV